MDDGFTLPGSSGRGRIAVTGRALARLVAATAAEAYGVVGLAPRSGRVGRLVGRVRPEQAVSVERTADGAVAVHVHVVVEHGLNLEQVSQGLRGRVEHELRTATGLEVASVDVHVESVRDG